MRWQSSELGGTYCTPQENTETSENIFSGLREVLAASSSQLSPHVEPPEPLQAHCVHSIQ